MMAKLRIFAIAAALMAAQITFAPASGKLGVMAYGSQSQGERGKTAV
jgi:hypothetical protein